MKRTIFIILLAIFFIGLAVRVVSYWKEYTTPFKFSYWEKRYNESQWADPHSTNPIGDDGLFAYAGWEYIHGQNPTYYVPGYPPLGLYIIGLFTVIFQNQNIFALVVGLSVLGVFYLLNLEVFKNYFTAFIPVFLFSFEPLFIEQLRAPYLDLLHLFFLLLTFLFFLKKRYIVSSIFLGCFIGTKLAFLGILPPAAIILFMFFKRKKEIVSYVLTLAIAFVVYLLTYLRFFILGNSFVSFLGVHKWILQYYDIGAKGIPGAVFPMLVGGVWYTWFAGVQKVGEWQITWPIIFLLTLVYGFFLVKKKKIDSVTLFFFWVLCYIFFLVFTPIFPRYLLLLIPFLYNLSIWVLIKNIFPKRFSSF